MFQPLHSLVAVVLDKKDSKTAGGLLLPDNFAGQFITGIVRSVSPDIAAGDESYGSLSSGSHVLIAQHMQQTPQGLRVQEYPTLDDDGIQISLCNVQEILGIIDDANITP